jgi:hypothetical protein
MSAPGRRLRALAARVCSQKTMGRLVDPIVADMQIEYAASSHASAWRRACVLAQGYAGFWKALLLHTVSSAARQTDLERDSVFGRTAAFSIVGFLLVTLLLTLPPLLSGIRPSRGAVQQAVLAVTLIPQALPISIPIGLCIGIVSAMRVRTLTRRHLSVTLTIALMAACLVSAVIEWALPWGNQAFRQMVLSQLTDGQIAHIEPGLNELGFSGLARRTDVRAVRQYHLMWALSFAAIPLAVFSLGVGARVRRAALRAGLILVAVFAYYAALWVSDSSVRHGAPVLMAWAPNVLFVVVGVLLLGGRWRDMARPELQEIRSSRGRSCNAEIEESRRSN